MTEPELIGQAEREVQGWGFESLRARFACRDNRIGALGAAHLKMRDLARLCYKPLRRLA